MATSQKTVRSGDVLPPPQILAEYETNQGERMKILKKKFFCKSISAGYAIDPFTQTWRRELQVTTRR
jgi:hypothetical protein